MLDQHYKEERPWGYFERFTQNEQSTVKIIGVAPGKRLSLQRHAMRAEYWRILEGSGIAHMDGEDRDVSPGDSVEVPQGATHRLSAGPEGLTVLEIALGDFDENDIERLEDDFGRLESSA